jgi:TonB dependent receptor-like, beta-barrel
LPAIAVQSVQVLSNPFSAEYGKFSSGVVEVATRGGTDEWKWLLEDPLPRPRWINGSTHGISSASPQLTFAGPIKRGKLYLFQTLYYGYDARRVYSLPDPHNVRVQEVVNTYTQVDWNLSSNQRFTFMLTVDPQKTKFANINTFDPQPVTENYRQRGFFASGTHRWILGQGGFIQSLFSAKRLDARITPADPTVGVMTLFPDQNFGTFFERQDRRTRLYQWSQTFNSRPLQSAGRHLFKAGYAFSRSTYDGQISDTPVRVLRGDGTLSSTINFASALRSDIAKNEVAFFVQDTWQIHQRFTLDFGLRLDHDNLSAESINVAPRVGFVFAPTRDGRTAIRGGFGVFFDKIPINVANFQNVPVRTVTSFASDGTAVINAPLTFPHVIATRDQQLRVPYNLGWNLQFDRELRRGLLMRLGYEHREGYRDFYVDPVQSGGIAQLNLYNNGRQTYREFLAMLRWQPTERTTLYASYVRSLAKGELNDYNYFFGNFPYPLIRPNQFGPLSSDAPNRVLIWGVFPLPKKFDFVPILDVHTGFPFSRLDENWNFVGRRNQAGRFPTFVGFDPKIQYPVDFTFRKRRIRFRAGLTVHNVFNHFNPREVQQYGPSPNFGQFYNSVKRQFRIDGDFDF